MNREALLEYLKNKGVSEDIIGAFSDVRREDFVPDHFLANAYDDVPIPLSEPESSISPPSVIAFMLALLEVKPNSKVLEIGSGSGYLLALLSSLSKNGSIYGIEINPKLAILSGKRLSGNPRVHIFNSDGSMGLIGQAPFERIIFSATAPGIGAIYQILDQLSDPGILVAPIGSSLFQIIKKNKKIEKHEFPGFEFVKMINGSFR